MVALLWTFSINYLSLFKASSNNGKPVSTACLSWWALPSSMSYRFSSKARIIINEATTTLPSLPKDNTTIALIGELLFCESIICAEESALSDVGALSVRQMSIPARYKSWVPKMIHSAYILQNGIREMTIEFPCLWCCMVYALNCPSYS